MGGPIDKHFVHTCRETVVGASFGPADEVCDDLFKGSLHCIVCEGVSDVSEDQIWRFQPRPCCCRQDIGRSRGRLAEAGVGAVVDPEEIADASDSESSDASHLGIDQDATLSRPLAEAGETFSEFPGVPLAGLLAHSLSGIVHVANEDDYFSCGRKAPPNYKSFLDLASLGHHFEPCSQCRRALVGAES